MWKFTLLALFSGLIQYLVQSTARIYREIINELLPQVAEENRHNIQFDMIYALLETRFWRIVVLLPVAFLCTFILLPYDLAKGWSWIERRLSRFRHWFISK